MTKEQIVQQALENFQIATQIQAFWNSNGMEQLDGKLRLKIEDEIFDFNVEIKNELRGHILPKIFEFNQKYQPFLLIAYRIYPEIKKQLREYNIAYIEANGNFYFRDRNKWFWIESNTPLKVEQDNRNRAFTKTGLRVLFEFLNNPQLINQTYRQIAEYTGTSIGNITHIMNGLKEENLILSIDKNTFKIQDYQKVLIKWAEAYQYNLKPLLKLGTFRFLKENDFYNWQQVDLKKNITLWGSEPAGDILTNYLNPSELTIYTEESRSDLMKNYKLVPDANGRVQVYQKFWKSYPDELTVPPVLVYADLVNQNDRRCTETAEKIYEQYLQN
ncbi:type IV toxin-antitoxin system AbiEi family antitoxin [Emticicia agri]|uniref:Uncharacterized protein n=1 Tax=Emticicia agri TaxID=2492393 RepID=A0A4Q5LTE8_9BACT|nr:type IV toxin-antitoxin system AbiEi family antitoxin [Emticicia agri]RYU92719.1 hypothetical protein EWM59_25775 [Emticicia agri]